MKKTRYMMIAGLILAMASTSVEANTVDVSFAGVGLGRNVRVTLNGNTRHLFSGQMNHNIDGTLDNGTVLSGTYTTFCTELTEYVNWGTNPFEAVDLEQAPESGPMGAMKAQAITDIYAYAGGDQLLSSAEGGTANFASAFQIAIWEIVYDYDGTEASLDVAAGNLVIKSSNYSPLYSGVSAHVDNLLGAIGLNASIDDLFAISADGFQDQIVIVPLPAPLMLGCAGLALVAVRRRFKLK